MALALLAIFVTLRYFNPWLAIVPGLILILLYMVFRDPLRTVPSVALGVFSPVDGDVVEAGRIEKGAFDIPALRILIRINSFGTYAARAPVEGTIKDLGRNALWVQTDEGQDVVLSFSGYRFGLAPRSLAQFGERLGQGQRCAYLRLARFAEIEIPIDGKILVEVGETVVAGTDVIGNVHSAR